MINFTKVYLEVLIMVQWVKVMQIFGHFQLQNLQLWVLDFIRPIQMESEDMIKIRYYSSSEQNMKYIMVEKLFVALGGILI